MLDPNQTTQLQQVFTAFPALELAVLVGSRATGKQRPDSDWDFAIQWQRTDQPWSRLGDTETLRHQLAQHLNVPDSAIDLIDLPRARLAIRHVVAEAGIPLKGEHSLAWAHFLQRTWHDLEDYDWDKLYPRR